MIVRKSRVVPKYTHWMSRLTFITGVAIASNSFAQDTTYVAPDVNIFESPEQVFELPGSGDYLGPEEIRKYNFNNINEILSPYYTTKKNGTGLGLSIVNKIINDHNGELEFFSIDDGAKIEINFKKNGNRNFNS